MIATIRRVYAFWEGHRLLGVGLTVAMLLRASFTVVLAVSIKAIIDAVTGEGSTSLGTVIAALAGGYVLSAAAGIAAAYLGARANAVILRDVRSALFSHLQRLSLGFHTHAQPGDVIARFSTDMARLSEGVVERPIQGLLSVVSLAFYIPVMAALEPRLALGTIIAAPIAVVVATRLSPNPDPALDREQRAVAEVLGEVGENLASQPVLRAFGLGRRGRARFGARLGALQTASTTADFRVELQSVLARFSVTLVQIVIVALGAAMALAGSLTAGALAAFVALLTEFAWETTVIGSEVLPGMRKAAGGIRRIDGLLSTGPVVEVSEDPVPVPDAATPIRFDDVSFAYSSNGIRQLDGVTLEIPPGSVTAVVGSSGSGKSTLLSLLLRFYDPQEGAVRLDGVDIRDLDIEHLRSRMGVVLQDTFLFAASLLENITVGREDAGPDEVEDAIRLAGLTDLIDRLPEGADTRLGSGGEQVSGGQRQRIGIARALIRRPGLLLLDEVTAALDPATEAAINETMLGLRRGRTIVLVTHRLATASDADLIVVLDGGRVVEQGTFESLCAGGGAFQAMWDKQQGFTVRSDGRAEAVVPDRLRLIPVFAGLDDTTLSRVAARLRPEWFQPDEDVVVQGAGGDRFHVIARGVVEVLVGSPTGERVVAHLEDGDFFGEMALLEDVPRNATVRAVTPTSTLSLGRAEFETLLADSPAASSAVREVAARRAAQNLGP